MRTLHVTAAFLLGTVLAAQTWLDPSFSGNGLYNVPYGPGHDQVSSVMLQPDGKIIAVGFWEPDDVDMFIARFHPNGSPDLDFGDEGVSVHNAWEYDLPTDAALTEDGKIVVAVQCVQTGFNPLGQVLRRYTSDGNIDTSFGDNGEVLVDPDEENSRPDALVVHADGKIAVAGLSGHSFIISRLNANGTPDMGFGIGGRLVHQVYPAQVEVSGLVVLSDGRYRMLGRTPQGIGEPFSAVVVGYTSDGQLDADFGNGGYAWIDWGSEGMFTGALLALPDGSLLVAGNREGSLEALVSHVLPDGTMDSSFGMEGILHLYDETNEVTIAGLARDAEGRILAVGRSWAGFNIRSAYVSRFLGTGVPDLTFGLSGQLIYSGTDGYADARCLVIDEQQRLVVGGDVRPIASGTSDVLLLRYLPFPTKITERYVRPLRLTFDGNRLYLLDPLVDDGWLRIQDEAGKELVNQSLRQGSMPQVMVLPALAAGTYTVLLSTSQGEHIGRFTVTH